MTMERLIEMIDSVLAWGADHDADFRECLVEALDINEEEYQELFDENLNKYIYGEGYEGEEDEDEDSDDLDFDDAIDILDLLYLDDTAYDYYREAIEGLYYGGQASHETHGYTSIKDVISDAQACEKTNVSRDYSREDEEEEDDE